MAREVQKKGRNYVLYTDGCIRVDNVILSHPHLDKPYAGSDGKGDPAYGASFLMPKDTHEEVKEVFKTIFAELEAKEKIKVKGANRCLRDGDGEGPGCGKPETAGRFLLAAREKNAPILRDQAKMSVEPARATRVFYGGCIVNALVRPWAQNNKYGQRINANLLAVQFVKDGTPFGTGRITDDDADDIFDEVEDDAPRGKASSRVADDDDDL